MAMRRGSILTETVLVMPLLLLVIFGVVQFALVWTAKQMTAYAAFCATRAIMVVRPYEQRDAAQDAAEAALSWMCIAERPGLESRQTDIPGWGRIPGSASSGDRVRARVVAEGGVCYNGNDVPVAAVEVRFRFPLMIPGMAVNKIIASAGTGGSATVATGDFYADLDRAAGDPDTGIDGFWPWIELTETCVLPMPYSTRHFPVGGFGGTSLTALTGGGM